MSCLEIRLIWLKPKVEAQHQQLERITVKSKAKGFWTLYCSHVNCMKATQGDVYWLGLCRGPAWTDKIFIFNINFFNFEIPSLQVIQVVAFRILELLTDVFLNGGYLQVRKIACSIIGMFWIICVKGDSVTVKMEASDKVNQVDTSVESQSSERAPLFSNVFSEKSLGAAASTPSTRLGQQFMSRGLYGCRWATTWLCSAGLGRGNQTYSYESNRVFL